LGILSLSDLSLTREDEHRASGTHSPAGTKQTMGLLKALGRKLGLGPAADKGADLDARLACAPPVLVYQMGKVGSSSLANSLSACWPGLTVHTHSILKDEGDREDVRLVCEEVIRRNAPLFIISPVREPIGRNISAFFQRFERYVGLKFSESKFSVEELIDIFLQRYEHGVPLRWFDKNLRPIFGIDVFEHAFPADGVQILEHENTKLLLMRCEVPDKVKVSTVRRFLGLPGFRLISRNIGAEKDYGATYKAFTQAFSPPESYLRDMYESRFFDHFYGSSKSEWIKKWTRKDAGPVSKG
jgi:hypothetical protein